MTTPCLDPKGEVLQLLFENCRTFFSILHSVHTLTITQQRCERATNLIATPHRLPHGADTFLRLNTTVPNLFTKRSSTVPVFKSYAVFHTLLPSCKYQRFLLFSFHKGARVKPLSCFCRRCLCPSIKRRQKTNADF